ncbi:DUF4432 family protein [Schaalia sp. ZJ405]|uniref:DUF4432 family protein n=1 Tax=Schaalia sp. ZJ405 TaxID=2709403 RepID=UPI0013EACABA|nr:DUF4432 family protein [Schaalia sp. ZJ405]QPK80937.1 DUF4432 family protein [Schaalia sp. ZJ405]
MIAVSDELTTILRKKVGHLVGSFEQLIHVREVVLLNGSADGMRCLQVFNPQGISAEIFLDRCMDIGWAQASDCQLSWISPRGTVASARTNPIDDEWLHSFGGGLLTTCGLVSTGMPSEDRGRKFGLHGRIGMIPCERSTCELAESTHFSHASNSGFESWSDGLELRISGEMREAALGRENLRLRRTLHFSLNQRSIVVDDCIINDGYVSSGLMFRHHLNFGFPLVSTGSIIDSNVRIQGFREKTDSVVEKFPTVLVQNDAVEGVTYCSLAPATRFGWLSIVSPEGHKVRVTFNGEAWSNLLIWRNPSPGVNVLGVEPATSHDGGRKEARQEGSLLYIEPGESRVFSTRIDV